MKKNILNISIAVLLLMAVSGCENFLGQAPDDRLEIITIEQARMTVASAYNDYGVRFTDASSDNYSLVTGVATVQDIIEDLYTWSEIRDQEHQDSPANYWVTAYSSIATVNHALEGLEKITPKNEDEVGEMAVVKGEALLVRSYFHFMLVNLFGKHYNPQTAGNDLGVPYVTVPEKTLIQHYERASVEEVYTKAEEDMKEGIRLLEAYPQKFKTNKYHFTVPTMYLYASRFYTFRNKREDCELAREYAEKALKAFGGIEVMRRWGEYQEDPYGPVDINQPEVGMVQESYTWTEWVPLYYYMTKPMVGKEFKNPFGFSDDRFVITWSYPGDMLAPAFYAVSSQGGSEIDIFPLAEAVFNLAEAYTRLGQTNEAFDLMKKFARNVYADYKEEKMTEAVVTNYYVEMDFKSALLKYILFERQAQFLYKGYRWFDIRRYNLDVVHPLRGGGALTLSKKNPDRVYQIPRAAISQGITPNPR